MHCRSSLMWLGQYNIYLCSTCICIWYHCRSSNWADPRSSACSWGQSSGSEEDERSRYCSSQTECVARYWKGCRCDVFYSRLCVRWSIRIYGCIKLSAFQYFMVLILMHCSKPIENSWKKFVSLGYCTVFNVFNLTWTLGLTLVDFCHFPISRFLKPFLEA